ncbi:hypothetical protein AVEN_115508-1 [Araneus ventricosus]|uniref:Uncharacterized protein n=1 Tax=Araneus ventricosus TaxID=182803 RepID=A0A4Y2CI92_ARAVE|nr:hypothetical protein AVEN_115508-1 [Araneus ventricosus]
MTIIFFSLFNQSLLNIPEGIDTASSQSGGVTAAITHKAPRAVSLSEIYKKPAPQLCCEIRRAEALYQLDTRLDSFILQQSVYICRRQWIAQTGSSDLHTVPDSGAGERVPYQPLPNPTATH